MMVRILLILMVFMVTACAQAPVSFDYDSAARMPAMTTYAFAAPPSGAQFQSLDNTRIETALRKQLASRTLKEVPREAASFLVAYRVEQQRKLDDSGVSFGFGFGSGNLGMGVSTGPKPKEIIEGKLVVDVVDPARQQVVWSAKANRYLRDSMKPEQRDALIGELVAAMLANFPPQEK